MKVTPGRQLCAVVIVAAGLFVHPAAAVVAAVGCYAVACWWFPIAYCLCCGGSGVHRSASGRTARPCRFTLTLRPCGGKRQRLGRLLFGYLDG